MKATAVKERPILFSGEMVRAILDGRKTQTRRVVKPQPGPHIDELHGNAFRKRAPYPIEHDDGRIVGFGFQDEDTHYRCPYGQPGDRLWVREAWGDRADYAAIGVARNDRIYYAADGKKAGWKYRPSIHMPRWASRITLEITGVRVERLQDITEEDAIAEGFVSTAVVTKDGSDYHGHYAYDMFAAIWWKTYGSRSWDANPWVWVISFKRLESQ